jgi:guanylate kinase
MAGDRGRLIVLSGPSGSGKSTLVRRLFELAPGPLVHSVSATTRPPRPGEIDGVHYHFLSPAEFQRRRADGEFLECFEVFGRGHWYGTLRQEVAPSLAAGKWVLLEIDVHGMQAVVREFPDAVTIFVLPGDPPDLDRLLHELERRLRARGTETEAAIHRRLEEAASELTHAGEYRHRVVNDDVERAARQLCDILTQPGG